MLRVNPPFLSDSGTMGWPAAGKGATFGRAHLSPVMGSNGTQRSGDIEAETRRVSSIFAMRACGILNLSGDRSYYL